MADRTIRVRLVADINTYTDGLKRASKATSDFASELNAKSRKANDTMQDLGRSAALMGGAMLAGFGVAAHATIGFDSAISELGAVADATGDKLATLRQAALDAGRDTVFSASEAAQAEVELAKAGVAAADILGGGLNGALNLAAAGHLDLARAAEIAASTMTTFGLHGADVGRIADSLAAGANKSAADVDDMALALQQSGLVAHQFGISMEETVGTLASFAQNGLRGSDAGTSFKTMLQRLVPQSVEAANKMDELGLHFFDAQGKFVGIAGAADQLHAALANLTQQQQIDALTTLFGSDAIRGATILFQEAGTGVTEWTSAVTDSGYAADLAATKMDNLGGDLEQLRGSIETALIQGGSRATGALRGMAQGATDLVNSLVDLPGPVQTAGVAFAGVGGALLTAGGLAGIATGKFRNFQTTLAEIGPRGAQVASGLGKIGPVIGRVGIALAAGAIAWTAYDTAIRNADAAAEAFKTNVQDRLSDDTFSELVGHLGDLRNAADGLRRDAQVGLYDRLNPFNAGYLESLRAGADALDETVDAQNRVIDAAIRYSNITGQTIDDSFAAVVASEQYAGILDGSLTPAAGGAEGALDTFRTAIDEANTALDTAKQKAQDTADVLFGSFGAALNLEDASARRSTAVQHVSDVAAAVRRGEATHEDYEQAVRDANRAVEDEAQALVDSARDQATLSGAVLGGVEAMDLYRWAIGNVADDLAPGSDLRDRLTSLITDLDATAGARQAEIDVETANAQAAVDALNAAMALSVQLGQSWVSLLLPPAGDFNGEAPAGSLPSILGYPGATTPAPALAPTGAFADAGKYRIGGLATGGQGEPGSWDWVGEHGPELVNWKANATVFDAKTSAAMSSGTSSMDLGPLLASLSGVGDEVKQLREIVHLMRPVTLVNSGPPDRGAVALLREMHRESLVASR